MNYYSFIDIYFGNERIESFIFLFIGITAILLSLFFLLIIKYSFFKGMSYPFLLIGIIQVIVGTNIILRTQEDIERVKSYAYHSPIKIKTEEIPRIQKVIRNFELYKIAEILLSLTGMALYFFFSKSMKPFWKGLGLGLLIQSLLLLILDLIAEDRASKYLDELLKITI